MKQSRASSDRAGSAPSATSPGLGSCSGLRPHDDVPLVSDEQLRSKTGRDLQAASACREAGQPPVPWSMVEWSIFALPIGGSIMNSISTRPARSKISVALCISPSVRGAGQTHEHDVIAAMFQADGLAGQESR